MAKAPKRRIIFMGTPEFASVNLKKLLQAPNLEIVGVVTQPDRPSGRGMKLAPSAVKKLALAHNLPLFQPSSLKDPEFASILANFSPEFIVVASYGLILPHAILALAPCLNVHASLLPLWRGAAPVQRALQESWKPAAKTGISIMKMEKGLDTGPVYCMAATKSAAKTWQALDHELAEMGAEALIEVINNFEALAPVPQDDTQATYAEKLAKADGIIKWNEPAAKIEAQIRAMNPWPGAHAVFEVDGNEIAAGILAAEAASLPERPQAGQVLLKGNKIYIGCSDAWLSLHAVKPVGRKVMNAQSFKNGYLGKYKHVFARMPEAG